MAANYGTIEMIDDRVGQILPVVERLGQIDNTIVVFTADHGDMMGDHGLLLKGFTHYRGALQVPVLKDSSASVRDFVLIEDDIDRPQQRTVPTSLLIRTRHAALP